jgi:hypothetical protein
MTPTAVGLVLVEADGVNGNTKVHDTFEMSRGGYSQVTTSAFVAEALSRTRAIADGRQVQSIGLTWSDDAAVEASLLLDSLMESGFENIVPIRLPEATEAFARGIGHVIGTDVTAVCVVEPEVAAVLVVNPIDYRVQTTEQDQLQSNQDLIDWLSELLERDGWQPDALVLLGSVGELPKVARQMEHILGIPAFAPAEGELALARGAALASTKGPFDAAMMTLISPNPPAVEPRTSKLKQSGAIAMLAAGVLTFVVSSSIALGMQMLPDRSDHESTTGTHVVNTAETPTGRQSHSPVPAPTSAAPVEPIQVETTPAAEVPEPAPESAPIESTHAVEPGERTDDAPAVDDPSEQVSVEPTPVTETAAETDPATTPAPQAAGPKPSLATRILQRLPGSHSVTNPTS